jgi:hypothetical protein
MLWRPPFARSTSSEMESPESSPEDQAWRNRVSTDEARIRADAAVKMTFDLLRWPIYPLDPVPGAGDRGSTKAS